MKNLMHVYIMIIFIVLIIMYFISIKNTPEPFTQQILDREQKLRKFPFRFLKDENNNTLPIVAVSGFFRCEDDKQRFKLLQNDGIEIIGITAYRDFPNKINDIAEDKFHLTDDFDYTNSIKVWLYCMKDFNRYGLNESQHALLNISESDFYTAPDQIDNTPKKYDFIYVCLKDNDTCPLNGWQAIVRNFDLALKCFPILFTNFNLKALIVGRVGCGLENLYPNNVEITDFLPYHELQQKMKESRFLFVPNISDASPRVIAECLIKNVPILINQNILCGFKYINEQTGVFFNNEHDISQAINLLLTKLPEMTPQKWWLDNHSHKKNSILLRNFLYTQYPHLLENIKEVSLIV